MTLLKTEGPMRLATEDGSAIEDDMVLKSIQNGTVLLLLGATEKCPTQSDTNPDSKIKENADTRKKDVIQKLAAIREARLECTPSSCTKKSTEKKVINKFV